MAAFVNVLSSQDCSPHSVLSSRVLLVLGGWERGRKIQVVTAGQLMG